MDGSCLIWLHELYAFVFDQLVMLSPGRLLFWTVTYPITHAFNIYEHLGNLSPYFTPENTPSNLKLGIPEGCTVDRGFLVHRHGSRHPISSELPTIQNISYYINNHSSLFSNPKARLPSEFNFLTKGWTSTFTLNDLSPVGRQQLFDHGVNLRLAYPTLYTNTVLAGDQDRVVESAQWFMQGYYGRNVAQQASLTKIAEDNVTVSWITPMDTCQAWTYSSGNDLVTQWGKIYLPRISTRINKLLDRAYPGITFTPQHAHGMLWACAYGTAVYGPDHTPWCAVFSQHEILDFEYELDLLMRGAFGYGLPRNQGAVLGSLLVQNLTTFMLSSSSSAANSNTLSLNFAHDTTIDLGLTALGLASDSNYPASGPPDPKRSWRTAEQVPFAAQMFWKRLACPTRDNGTETRIQLELNGANFDLSPTGCRSDRFGSCNLQDFAATEKVRRALGVRHGDETWQAACAAR